MSFVESQKLSLSTLLTCGKGSSRFRNPRSVDDTLEYRLPDTQVAQRSC